MDDNGILSELVFIKTHLAFLPSSIKKLEKDGLLLIEAVEIMKDAKDRIANVPGSKGRILQEKFRMILDKNPGFADLTSVASVLQGNEKELPISLQPTDVSVLQYCPVVSADVEPSFSI